jgi:hypothetical protein
MTKLVLIRRQFIPMGCESGQLAVHRQLDDKVAGTWECSCGKSSPQAVVGFNITAIIESARRDYWAHCADAHPKQDV